MKITKGKLVNGIEQLVYLMARLRKPETGCPWDIKQDFLSIVPHTLEESYEVVDAIERGDFDHLQEELGDLFFQVIFYSQMAKEQALFGFDDVLDSLVNKLLERHPHVFPDGTLKSERDVDAPSDTALIKKNWENLKVKERALKGERGRLADIPLALPALTRAQKIQKRASHHGFDWPDCQGVLDKVEEELAELREAFDSNNAQHIEEELGDLIFSCVNFGRHQGFDVEASVRKANKKFEKRFHEMEVMSEAAGEFFDALPLDRKNALWQQVKKAEKG